MPVRVVRLGSPRSSGEGPRLGTVRRPPRGVKKADHAKRDFYDAWLPELAPSAALVASAMAADWTAGRWQQFARRYRRELNEPAARHLLETLAALSKTSSFSVGCYCEDEDRCHRSILRAALREAGASVL